ncbi:MAG: P-type conjugative transfer protein TrbL [Paracoccaceae bacterium]|nr:P-type conjugative transfer protein TrbL [Paracoccaceae bacterium]
MTTPAKGQSRNPGHGEPEEGRAADRAGARDRIRLAVFVLPALTGLPSAAGAQDAPGELDRMIRSLEQISAGMTDGVTDAAVTLLYTLAAIEFAWTFAKGTLQGEGLSALLMKVVARLVSIGVLVLCLSFGGALVRLVIDSAIAVARVGGSAAEPSPSAILSQALQMAGRLLGEVSILSPGHSIGLVLITMAVAITAAAMAAFIVVVYAELYLVAVAGLLGLAFGGLESTRDIAMAYLRMLLGKGFKLLTLLVVNGLVMATLESAFQAEGDLFSALQILIIQVVGLMLVLRLPSAVEGMTSGAGGNSAATTAGGFAAMTAWRATAATARTGGSALYGGARGGVQAARAAHRESLTATALGVPPPAGLANAAAMAGPVARGAVRGAASGAVTGLAGDGPQRQAAKDVLAWLDRSERAQDD